ncbi:hypothetical protein KCU92_g2966, partial [Aureobasidium melanogenum]|jgi:hypothetical protein
MLYNLFACSILAVAVVHAIPITQTSAPEGYWSADIYQGGCADGQRPQDNPKYTFVRQEALPCTSIQGYGYQSVNFDDPSTQWAVNVYTDADCTIPLTENFSDGCITTPEGQFVMAISVDRR